jgi:hypothetical protein
MIMRVGQSAESFAWAAVFILMPVSGVYYPVERAAQVAAGDLLRPAAGLRLRGHARDHAGEDGALGQSRHRLGLSVSTS